jgi:hypothetical protein
MPQSLPDKKRLRSTRAWTWTAPYESEPLKADESQLRRKAGSWTDHFESEASWDEPPKRERPARSGYVRRGALLLLLGFCALYALFGFVAPRRPREASSAPRCAAFVTAEEARSRTAAVRTLFIGDTSFSHEVAERYRAMAARAMPAATLSVEVVATGSLAGALAGHQRLSGRGDASWTHVVLHEESRVAGLVAIEAELNGMHPLAAQEKLARLHGEGSTLLDRVHNEASNRPHPLHPHTLTLCTLTPSHPAPSPSHPHAHTPCALRPHTLHPSHRHTVVATWRGLHTRLHAHRHYACFSQSVLSAH